MKQNNPRLFESQLQFFVKISLLMIFSYYSNYFSSFYKLEMVYIYMNK